MNKEAWCAAAAGGARIRVQVTPNARKTEILGVQDGALKIKLQAQPIEGKANEALVRFLSDRLDVPRKAITLTHGASARQKSLTIDGIEPTAVERRLLSQTDS